MSVTYRFIGINYDVQLDTDAVVTTIGGVAEFFITDIRGLDAEEVRAGFNIGLHQYNENQLVQFALDNALALYSFDDGRNQRCLVMPGVDAGQFFSNSRLRFPNFNLPMISRFPIELRFTFRKTDAEWTKLRNGVRERIIEDLESAEIVNVSLGYSLGTPILFLSLANNHFFQYRFQNPLPVNQCIEVRCQVLSSSSMIELYINDELVASLSRFEGVVDEFFSFVVGDRLLNVNSFTGIMRNIRLIVGGETLLDVPDPSTGINLGLVDNGTPENIESVTVIV